MSTPNAGNTASPAPSNLGYPFISNPSPQAGGAMNFQPQQYMAYNDMSTASPIPGASGGQGDPGPSSMAQHQQGQFRPQFQQGGLTPQQMAMLQQFSQAAQNQGSQGQGQGQPRQFTSQQMQMAMASMQAQQGGNVNPQALMAAMRATQQGQQQQQPQQGQQQQQQRPPNQQMNGFGNAPQQGGPPGQQNVNPAQVAYQQQQRIQQMMQNRPNPGSPVRPHQQPNSMPPPPVPNTQQQQQQHPQQQQPSQQGNFGTPQQNVGVPQQMGNNPQGGFHLTQQQRDFLTNQRNALFSNPQFLAMPPQQQQAVIMSQQQQILRNMTAGQMPQVGQQTNQQQQAQQQQQQQYQQPQQAQTPTGRPTSAHGTPGSGQSPSIPRQPTPQQMGTPQAQQVQTPQSAHVQTPQQPLSSLPQHMAPPRPASAASQRAPSPHQGMSGMPGSPATMQQPSSTPPPSSAMFPSSAQQMVNAPSPTPSNVSHHSVHQTPAQSHMQPPPHSVSPVHARSQTPSQSQQMQIGTPQSAQSMNQVGINGQYQGNQQSQLQHQPQQQNMGTPQQPSQPYPQAFPGANQAGPSSSPAQQGAFPVQPIVPSLQNLTPAQQQQMASAMSFMSQAAQAQQSPMPGAGQQQVRPNQQAQSMTPRPPAGIHVPNINTSDFPFDPRLLPHIQHVNDEKWRSSVNPQLVAAVQSAAAIVPTLRHDIIQRMQNVLFHTARIQAAQGIRPPAPGQLPQQGDQTAIPGFSPTAGQAGTPGAIPANQQQRIWQAQQAAQAQGSPVSANSGSPAIRPPPPHLPPASNMPGSPSPRISSLDRRSSGSGKDKMVKGEKTPQQASMPPPNYIPSHTAGPSRPSTHAPAEASIPPPLPSAAPQIGLSQNIKVTAQGLPVKEWETALRVDLPITNITALPVNDIEESEDPTFKGALPPMSEFEKIQVARWVEKDKAFVENEKEQHPKRMAKMKRWAEENDKSTPWWMLRKGEMRAKPQQRLRILWPSEKEKDRMNRTHRNRKVIKFSPAQVKSMAEVEDHIVPVRLDLEHESFKLKDTFMWNVSDKVVTPEIFAQCLCDDFQVPYQHFQSRIVAAIQERVQEYQSHVLPIVQRRSKEDNRGKLDPDGDADSRAMLEIFRKIREGSGIEEEIRTDPGEEHNDDVKIVSFGGLDGHEDEETLVNVDGDEGESEIKKELVNDDRPMTVEEAMQCLPKEETEELRILIKVDIIVGTQNLSDSFEWDLNSSVTPEEFSASYVTELGLSKEFATALAHDIHEQILVHKRSLFLTGHAFGSGLVLDDELRLAFLPPVTTSLRKEDVAMSSYTPIFNELREDQLALLESQREKESKRKKRAGRARRGVVLPDRDPIKTQRSLLNPLGSNGLPVFSAPELIANTKDSAPMHRRRGAAIAAEANMALIAQDLPITGPPSPAHTNHYHGPTISARGKRIGRPPKNLSRGSPASFSTGREGSMITDSSQMLATPQLSHIGIGIKRSFREDSIDDLAGVANGSPAISRKRRIADSPPSPEFEHTPVKQDLHPIQEEKKVMEHMGWHCRNCGIPESLSNGKGKDKTGAKVLCGDCSRYLFRTGKPRPCEFTTDESYHLSLKHKNEQSRRSSLSQRPRSPSSSTPTATAPTTGFNSPIKPDSNSNSNSESSDTDSSSEDESDSTFASSSRGPKKEKSGRGRGRGKKEVVDTTPVKPPVQTQGTGRSPTVGISPSSAKKVIEMPTWASRALAEMRSKYPRDDFVVVQKPRPQGMDVSGPVEWRAKCMDCPGKIYSLGPGETLQNFEVHLKNRAHIANRLNREGKTH
ncbi:hypothetical protein I302_103063 [Kwoniella bestiolae CBS 10118]|uniref:SWI/SNF chromatin-remodeling complex subunit snf5 n=1 Tax=Kwoniella bestiolae CBS 10118 TaxID=1296100 RepID=A0A1B9GGQ2_9TREE|nr:hypothetical protein I302_01761 [Kwoniella bestiolae CBS 10118]OCF30242.1 hypothetical protein I302_01761 [Kwoniella bestiolae CBS 10118]